MILNYAYNIMTVIKEQMKRGILYGKEKNEIMAKNSFRSFSSSYSTINNYSYG